MELTRELRRDHELIDRVLGSLCAFVEAAPAGIAHDGPAFVRFFRDFAGRHHHAAEEHVLFPALAEIGLDLHRGPLAVLAEQHRELRAVLDEMEPMLAQPFAGSRAGVMASARRYAHGLWRHIDAENSVLLPEADVRLGRAGVYELPITPGTAESVAARSLGERLVAAWPSRPDPTAWRGEGCIVCSAYGRSCDGVEREWWNDAEWEEFADHLG